MDESIISFTRRVDKMSSDFEKDNSELKRLYLIKNIFAFNIIAKRVHSFKGSFGTGYPFYALTEDLQGELPIIKEQLRYNRELSKFGKKSKRTLWSCRSCLQKRRS